MSGPALDRVDHLVLTVRDVEATCAFDRVEAKQWRHVWPRPGRRAIAFEGREGRWLAVHTRFSLTP